ncbi:MAG: hypothetical protein HZC29_03880, partial [Thaumarchaeota archaeon]|nr:hypothetical protein [Nitrososphaerota archaeon]
MATQCSDGIDNDKDGLIDYPNDPGCENALDQDEKDPVVLTPPLSIDLPDQFVNVFQTSGLYEETVVTPLPSQEQRAYEFILKAKGGNPPYKFSVKGGSLPGTHGFLLKGSGLQLKESGTIVGLASDLKAGHYRYSLQIIDAEKTFDFILQAKVLDAFGNDVGIPLQTSFQGTEHKCFVGQVCEAFFVATSGVAPYQYRFSGESPSKTPLFQLNADQAFYRFTPSESQIGKYKIVLNVFDSSTIPDTADAEKKISKPNKTTLEFTLVIEKPPVVTLPPVDIPGGFKFSAEKSCEFLDVSAADENFLFIQF